MLFDVGGVLADTLVLAIFLPPLAGVLGIWLANCVFLRNRRYSSIVNALLASIFTSIWSMGVFFVLKFGLVPFLISWLGSVVLACLVWHAATG
jgi:hypothetical protein